MRECDIEAVRQLFPILQVIDVLNKLGVVKVAMLSEICDAERAPMGRQNEAFQQCESRARSPHLP